MRACFGVSGGEVPARPDDVVLRGAQLGAVERQLNSSVVGPFPCGLGVLGDRHVVVLALFGDAGRVQGARRGAGRQQQAGGHRAGQPPGGEASAGSRVIGDDVHALRDAEHKGCYRPDAGFPLGSRT